MKVTQVTDENRTYTEIEVEQIADELFREGLLGVRGLENPNQNSDSETHGVRSSLRRVRSAVLGNISLARFHDRHTGDHVELAIKQEVDEELDMPNVHSATLTRTSTTGDVSVVEGHVLADRISTREDRKDSATPFRYVEAGAAILVGIAAAAGTLYVAHRHKRD